MGGKGREESRGEGRVTRAQPMSLYECQSSVCKGTLVRVACGQGRHTRYVG